MPSSWETAASAADVELGRGMGSAACCGRLCDSSSMATGTATGSRAIVEMVRRSVLVRGQWSRAVDGRVDWGWTITEIARE
ncbi:hypothetical protein ACRE_089200 [Hapsidospora chrysogenum ATCC 11550]|uniref:Uncharacterized protein n=1 Tax=Hapsidospora chrysogenum (strain ATCC 11550 / CBS 779.69 / DSM 880 / IAM 14645 / JCM 23072 / IMI 49137) TaxID=857340 RepID=A0A086STI3_HAPC1|nr:hypothetical protein ACRE_089200 [Hapsidospora chrysogenum ATCC 11550]